MRTLKIRCQSKSFLVLWMHNVAVRWRWTHKLSVSYRRVQSKNAVAAPFLRTDAVIFCNITSNLRGVSRIDFSASLHTLHLIDSLFKIYLFISYIATTQPEQARVFYSEVLGLRLMEDTPFALVFDANGTMLRIQKVQTLTLARHTVLGIPYP